jgi:2-methylcitrate dehydratase PrpD
VAVTLDTLGAILAGSRLAENARLADVVAERSGSRAATLVGRARKAEPLLAALANGTAGVSLEMDEGNPWGGGHPAIHVLPATLAVAEELGVDGRRFIEALVAGTVYNHAARRRRPRAAIALPYPLPGPPRRRHRRCSHASAPLSCCCSPS